MKKLFTLKACIVTLLLFSNEINAQEPGQAYYFKGPTSDGVSAFVSNPGSLDFSTGTVEGWIRPNFDINNPGGDDPFIFSMMDYFGKRWGIRMGKDYGSIGVVEGGSGWNTSWLIHKFEKGRWYHLAAIFNTDQTITIYINGISIGTSTVKMDLGQTGKPLKMGISNSWDNGNLFQGAIDEVRIWNIARSETDIKNNMNTNILPSTAGLVAYYKFEQTATGALPDFTTNALNGNIGAWINDNSAPNNSPNWVESYAMVVPRITLPSNINKNSFTINWQASLIGNADSYIVDIATDASFNNIISGYNSLNVGNVLTKEISGLTESTTYFYRVRANKSSVSGQGAYSTTSSVYTENTLPLSFLKFITIKENNVIHLRWETANEINTSHFNILHSTDGVIWNIIDRTDAKGLANNIYDYRHTHTHAAKNYYKLQQVDVNGDFAYSEIKIANFIISEQNVKIYPNPVSDILTVELTNSNKHISYSLINTIGNKVKKGIIDSENHQIDVKSLRKGIYFFQVEGDNPVKIIKQ